MPNESEDPPDADTGGDYRSNAEILRDQYPELRELRNLVIESGRLRIIIIKKSKWGPVPKNARAVRILNKLHARCKRRLKNYHLLEKLLMDTK